MEGFFACFSRYRHKIAPLSEIYEETPNVRRVKQLLSEIVECKNPKELKEKIGAHEIKPIRPKSSEDCKVIGIIGDAQNTPYKIDYGNNRFRIYFSLATADNNMAYIYIIDTKHRFYNN
jgi:hypothetical protein